LAWYGKEKIAHTIKKQFYCRGKIRRCQAEEKKRKIGETAQKPLCFSSFHQHPDTRVCKRKKVRKRKAQKAEKWLDKAKNI